MADELDAVLLPGLDGTGAVFAPFLAALPAGWRPHVVTYPGDAAMDYDACTALARAALPASGRWLLIAESFSGPVAIRLAAEAPPGLVGCVLAASFARPPVRLVPARLAGWAGRLAFGMRPPLALLRWFVTGGDRELAALVQSAVAGVRAEVLAERMRGVLSVDVRDELACCPVPVLYLSGARDRLVGKAAAVLVARTAPAARWRPLPAPHLVLQSCPELCVQVIREWLADVDDAAG